MIILLDAKKPLTKSITLHDKSLGETRETTPFITAPNNIQYSGATMTKKVKDLYDKNSTSLKKEIEKISEDEKISQTFGLAGLT